jgi:hypothetical protein
MLGFGGARLALYGIAALAVVSIIGLGYAHYKGLLEDNARLRVNEAVLTQALATQRAATEAATDAIAAWRESAAELGKSLGEMALAQQSASAQMRRLNDVFAKHDLEALSIARPGLIERRINGGTASALRVLECATGGGADCAAEGRPADDAAAARPDAD